MRDERWAEVDRYLHTTLGVGDAALDAALAANAEAGLPAIDVSALQGRLLEILARMMGARRTLEIGTLGGFSTISMARGVGTGGRVITLEAEPDHAAVALANIARAGLSNIVDLRVGLALDILPTLLAEAPFDMIFIDADKESMVDYLDWALLLSRIGTLIVGDNVVRGGEVANPHSRDASVKGVQGYLQAMGKNPRLLATALQTVGEKGWDGLAMALVVAD